MGKKSNSVFVGVLPFNKWSLERIKQGRKFCTSRSKLYNDPRVESTVQLPLWFVAKYLWQVEGADSPAEFRKVWSGLHRGRFSPNKLVYVHFGDFREE